jgi:hypothetical protein
VHDEQRPESHGRQANQADPDQRPDNGIANPSGAAEGSQIPGPAEPEGLQASPPQASERGQVVANALDDLAGQISQAASDLRGPDPDPARAESRQLPWCEARSIVDLVMHDLTRRGIKTDFGPEADLASAERSAGSLLSALGVAFPDARQPARACDPAG